MYPSPLGALAHIRAIAYWGGDTCTGPHGQTVAPKMQVLWLARVKVFAVGVQDTVDWELREMASALQDTHVFSVDSFLALRGVIQELVVVCLCGAVTQAGDAAVVVEAKGVPRDVTCTNKWLVSLPY